MDFYVGKFKAERGSFITLAKGNRSKAVTQVHMHAYIHTYIHTYTTYILTLHTVQYIQTVKLTVYKHISI